MKKNKLIVFDIDGTLTNSVQPHQQAFIKALQQIGVKNIDSNFSEYKHHTDSYIAKVIYENDLKQEFYTSKLIEFEHYLMKNISRYDISEIAGAKNLIEHLNLETSCAVCYATGSLLQPALFKLNSVNIQFPKQLLVASNHIMEREKIVQQAIENAKNFYQADSFDRIISVGDGLWDLKTANNLAIEFIGIGTTNKRKLLDNGMLNHFDNLVNFVIS